MLVQEQSSAIQPILDCILIRPKNVSAISLPLAHLDLFSLSLTMSNPSLGTKPKGFKTPGPEHIFDFPSLIIDHQPSSQKVVPLVDVDVTVYGLDEIAGSKLPIGVIVRCCLRM